METITPPITPSRQYTLSPLETSPTSTSFRDQLRRRTSSFSSNHDRSPVSSRKNRFSNASQYSTDFSPDGGGGGGMGMGNLADELDQLDDDVEEEEDVTEGVVDDGIADEQQQHKQQEQEQEQPSPIDGARDSGIDVSYSSKKNSPRIRNFSKPFSLAPQKPPDDVVEEVDEETEEKLSPALEDAMNNIARMTSYTSTAEDPLIPRTLALLQDLGNQSTLEAHAQRLTTSTNSVTSHLAAQSKALQTLSTSLLYSPFSLSFSAGLDADTISETTELLDALRKELPLPDPAPLHGMQKLDRETGNVVHTLSQLTDTLQMGRQTTNSASRHLRTTQTIVAELRRERERAEVAREELGRSEWEGKVKGWWCKRECEDVMDGFERKCEELRESLVSTAATAGAGAGAGA